MPRYLKARTIQCGPSETFFVIIREQHAVYLVLPARVGSINVTYGFVLVHTSKVPMQSYMMI